MTSNSRTHIAIILCALGISGCPGLAENERSTGLVVHLAETHQDLSGHGAGSNTGAATGGYAYDQLEYHTLRDTQGTRLSMYRAYLILDNITLMPCSSLSYFFEKAFAQLISTAHAHGGHGTAPVSGRALDQPNVIDIITREEYILPLGDLAIAPGRYCGATVTLTPLNTAGYGVPTPAAASQDDPITQPEVPNLLGKRWAISADYCVSEVDGICQQRAKIDIDNTALTAPDTYQIHLTEPLIIHADLPESYLAIGINYGNWLDGVDVTLLNVSIAERQKLQDNIRQSFFIYDQGLGELPPNFE
jgi:hypothetical protein